MSDLIIVKVSGAGDRTRYCYGELTEGTGRAVGEMKGMLSRANAVYERSVRVNAEMRIGTGAGPERKARDALVEKLARILESELTTDKLRCFEACEGAYRKGQLITESAEIFAVTAKAARLQVMEGIRRT